LKKRNILKRNNYELNNKKVAIMQPFFIYHYLKTKYVMMKNERKLIIENTKSSYREYLLEVDGGAAYLEKCKLDPNLPIYLVGIIQKGDAPNRNGRIYPFSILKKECDRYLSEEVKDGQSFGELDHPAESTVPELKNAAFTIEDIWYKGTEVWGKIKLLNAYMPETAPGKMARGIILNGKTIGISSRALGSVYQDQSGYDVVENDLEIICWDLVSRPSTYDANLRLAESAKKKAKLEKHYDAAYLTETKAFGAACDVTTSKQLIKEAKRKQLSEEDRVFLECLGIEKFLQLKNGK
jgi:hypothetical protein